jgi:hypothetical protein
MLGRRRTRLPLARRFLQRCSIDRRPLAGSASLAVDVAHAKARMPPSLRRAKAKTRTSGPDDQDREDHKALSPSMQDGLVYNPAHVVRPRPRVAMSAERVGPRL